MHAMRAVVLATWASDSKSAVEKQRCPGQKATVLGAASRARRVPTPEQVTTRGKESSVSFSYSRVRSVQKRSLPLGDQAKGFVRVCVCTSYGCRKTRVRTKRREDERRSVPEGPLLQSLQVQLARVGGGRSGVWSAAGRCGAGGADEPQARARATALVPRRKNARARVASDAPHGRGSAASHPASRPTHAAPRSPAAARTA